MNSEQLFSPRAKTERVNPMKESILRNKSKELAKNIVLLCKTVKLNKKESVITNQLLRSGTSIGANIYEAQFAHGKRDFISKLEIALKECNESRYWLDLLYETEYITEDEFTQIQNDCKIVMKMLIASINTVKKNLKSE